jgi:phosphate acetyltransferase
MSANVMQQLRLKAMSDPKTVVLPEADEEKILRAARRVKDTGIANPVLVGEPAAVSALAAEIGVSLEGLPVVDHTDEEKIHQYANEFVKVDALFSMKSLKRKLKNPLNFAAMMVRFGEADCILAGLTNTTGDVIMASRMIIGLAEGISTVSGMCIMSIPGFEGSEGNLLAIADCAVCPEPDAKELSDIAISTAGTVQALLGWEPRIALLSFSTKGSASHASVDTILSALAMVRERRPDLLIDGELQLDSAIVPEVASKKIKGEGSPVAGNANILIFPNLNAGNIGVKLVQQFGKAVAYGPLLQGFAKPVCDLSRGARVDEIVGAIAMVVACAQG